MHRKIPFFLIILILTVKSVKSQGRLFSLDKNDLLKEWTFFKDAHKKIFSNKSHESFRLLLFLNYNYNSDSITTSNSYFLNYLDLRYLNKI